MARSRKYKGTTRQRQAKAATRANISALKKKGLLKTVAAKSGKRPGGSIYAQLKRFKAVLEKKAAVLKAPAKTRKLYKGTLPIKHGKLVVPKSTPTEKPRIDRKTNLIVTSHKRGKQKLKSYKLPKNTATTDIPKGKNITYSIQMNNWQSKVRFVRLKDLLDFLQTYDLRNHMDAIEIVVGSRDDDEDSEEDEAA